MNRRRFNNLLLGSLLRPSLASAPLLALNSPARAAVDPATAFAIAAAVLKIIADMTRGDGGLGASLGALDRKADIIIAQLASLQKAVVELIEQVAKLNETILTALDRQYGIELRDDVLTNIERIRDLAEEARINKIDLAQGGWRKSQYVKRIPEMYEEFNKAHRRLWNADTARGATPSLVCSACLGIEAIVFSWGYIDAARFSVNLAGHLRWLDRILNPELANSAPRELQDELNGEADIVKKIIKEAQDNDVKNEIAAAVYSKNPICVRFLMDTTYFSETPNKGWYKTGESSMIFVVEYTRDDVNENGALLLKRPQEVETSRSAALQTPGRTGYAYGKAKTIDVASCKTFKLSEYAIASDISYRTGLAREWANSPQAYRHLTGMISQGLINNSAYFRALTNKNNIAAAQELLDRINLQRFKQAFVSACINNVVVHRANALALKDKFGAATGQNKPKRGK